MESCHANTPTRYDLFVALTAAAAATSRLRVGSGICLVIERDPIITAKEVASVDHLSGGRFVFGVGAGWNREEMRNHGTDPRVRMAMMRERVEAMKAIWTQDEASYHGEHVDFERIWSWPKPAQRPHRRCSSAATARRCSTACSRFGDAWLPNYAGEDLLDRARELWARAERPIDVMVMGVPAEPGSAGGVCEGRRAASRALDPLGGTRAGRTRAGALGGAIAELHGE